MISPLSVQQTRPFGRLRPRHLLSLPPERILPVIRIAHQVENVLEIPERIIFDHELVLILAGTGALISGRQRIAFGPHDLLFLRPFVPHRFVPLSGTPGAHIAVHFDFAAGVPERTEAANDRRPYQVQVTHGLEIPNHLSLAPGHRLEAAFFALLRERQQAEPLAPLAASNHLLTILIALFRSQETDAALSPTAPFAGQNQARVDAVITFIQTHFAEPLAAEALANVAGLSVSRLNTLFRQHTGYPPMEYVLRTRVDEARRLLADIHLSVKEVAARTGFHDGYHFSKAFRRVDGLSPMQYRDAVLAGRRG